MTSDPAAIRTAERLILPGVGAFANGMDGLRSRELIEPLREFATTGRPLLGICLGMQMLVDESEEFGHHEGLGLISGKVVAIAAKDESGVAMKVPHIGWSTLVEPKEHRWQGTALNELNVDDSAYFVHSFTVVPEREEDRLADTMYGNCRISAAVQKDNVMGCQFHPEKSGISGLKIIKAFLQF